MNKAEPQESDIYNKILILLVLALFNRWMQQIRLYQFTVFFPVNIVII